MDLNRICSYCGTKYGCRIGKDVKECSRCDGLCAVTDKQTHGICPSCYEDVMQVFERRHEKCAVQKNGSGGSVTCINGGTGEDTKKTRKE